MAGEISTPTSAVKTDLFSATQLTKVKRDFKLNGNQVFTLTKPSTNHIITIPVNDGFIYKCLSENIIYNGDTIEDLDSNAYTINLIGENLINYKQYFNLQIDGTVANIIAINKSDDILNLYNSSIGTSGSGSGQILTIQVLAVNNSNIFIADRGNDKILIYDLDGNFIDEFGSSGTSDGQFQSQYGIFATNNKIYVTDTGNSVLNRIQVFDIDGTFDFKFGSNGTGNGQFDIVYGIAVDDTSIYICDNNNDRVQIFDLTGAYQSQFGTSGTGNGQFNGPTGIAVNNDYLYVLDTGNDRVQIFDLSGTYVGQFGSTGTGDGQFSSPSYIAINGKYIYVTDESGSKYVQKFDYLGNFISKFVITSTHIPKGIGINGQNIFICDASSHLVRKFK